MQSHQLKIASLPEFTNLRKSFYKRTTLTGVLLDRLQNKNPSQNFFQEGFMCFGRESNPYGHCCPRDFKSRVSTYSTTKAIRSAKIIHFL